MSLLIVFIKNKASGVSENKGGLVFFITGVF